MNEITVGNSTAAEPDLVVFIKSLLTDGRAIVSASPLDSKNEGILPLLLTIDETCRAESGDDAPAFSETAARWSARMFYQLCQFVVCRDIGEEKIAEACAVACPGARESETDWSVDLIFHNLPGLYQLARHLSNSDPLVQQIKRLGQTWPLSSVGMPDLNELQLGSFIGHAQLRRLYADRIIAANDVSRLGDSRVDELLRADLGIHHGLAPGVAAKLFKETA